MSVSSTAGNATFSPSGVAEVTVTPDGAWASWTVTRITVITTSATDTEARVYRDAVSDGAFIEGTYSGNRDTSPWNPGLTLNPGQSLVVRWTGGTPGAVATVSVDYAFQ